MTLRTRGGTLAGTLGGTLGAVLATALACTAVPAVAVPAEPLGTPKPRVTLSVPTTVVEGEPFSLRARVSRTTGARQVQLLAAAPGAPWQVVSKTRARKKRTYSFTATAGPEDTVRYRVKVLYERGTVSSTPASTAVWHWTPMTDFEPYLQTPGVSFGNNVHITINGVGYRGGWETYGKYGVWESRVTPGRHCSALRGVVGISDDSADGSSAVVTVTAEETTPVYTSPTLTPGMSVPFQVALATPFRLGVSATRTSLPTLAAYPALATPELLCTGLG